MIAHSSFCNESVVISYGIVAANVQQISKHPNKMDENKTEKSQKMAITHICHHFQRTSISEVWVREKDGSIRLLYKKTDG